MAEQKKTPKRLITYGDNQYSFDELEKSVLGNYNNYAQKFGYNRDKFMKDYRALTEMLRLIKDDPNATFESGRINFSGNYATEKGAFGKARNNSKHYSHPAWMILDTLQGMTPYEEPKPERKKITKAGLQDAVKSEIVEGWNDLPDAEKQLAIKEALTNVMNRYKWDNPDLYELEDGRDLNYYRSMFDNALSALQTTDNPNDDLLRIYSTFGLTKPTQQAKEEEKVYRGQKARYIEEILNQGLVDTPEKAESYWNEMVAPTLIKEWTENFMKNNSISSTNNTSSSSNTPAGVVAASGGTNKPAETNKPAVKPGGGGGKEMTKDLFVERVKKEVQNKSALITGDLEEYWNSHKNEFSSGYNGIKNLNGKLIFTNSSSNGRTPLRHRAKNGMKINYLNNLKEYKNASTNYN